MDNSEHRLARLNEWLSEFDGRVAGFCRHYRLPYSKASFLSQVLSGHRALGEKAARRLESECGRPAGWLDLRSESPIPIRIDMPRVASLPDSDKKLIEDFVEFVMRRRETQRSESEKKVHSLSLEATTTLPHKVTESVTAASRRPITERTLISNERAKKQRKQAG